jgi:hypothetical protein
MELSSQPNLILIIGGVLLVVVIVALAIWRSRSESVIRVPVSASPSPGATVNYTPAEIEELAASGKLVEISHPLVQKSAEQALDKGGPMARYIVQHGGKLWMTFEPFQDQAERDLAYDLFRRFNAGEELDIREMVQIIGKMSK